MFRSVSSLLDRRQRGIGVDMACPRAVTEFADRVAGVRILSLLVWSRFIFVRVTCCAIRLERRVSIVNLFGVSLVTIRALQIAAMIQRLKRQRRMAVIRRHPSIGGMAHIALNRGAEVILVLADRLHAVMT